MDVHDQHRVAIAVALFTYKLYELPLTAAVPELSGFTALLVPKQILGRLMDKKMPNTSMY